MSLVSDGNAKDEPVQKNVLSRVNLDWNCLATCRQVHGGNIAVVQSSHRQTFPETDGLISETCPVVLGIFSADCLPVLFWDPDSGVTGAVHAGWRGTEKKIVLSALNLCVQKWRVRLDRAKVYIGPHIRSCCYIVGPELCARFSADCTVRRDGKLFLDLSRSNLDQLREAGIADENVVVDGSCTCCDRKFFSYRRDRTDSRMIHFIARTGDHEQN